MLNQDSAHTYQVTLINEDKSFNKTIQVSANEVIMDVAERHGIKLPVSCRAGACTSCTAQIIEGAVEHQHCFLSRQEEDAGFILTCTASPISNCTILTHQEDVLLNLLERP